METFRVTYHVRAAAAEIDARAQGIAIEQSVEMPPAAIPRADILDEVIGRVAAVAALGPDRFRVDIDYNVENSGFEPAQFVNTLFGNTSLQKDVVLADMDLPTTLLDAFGGPRFGMAGIRALTGARSRPLTATALKPLGASPAELAELCRTFARAGLDIIKDDHGLADQSYAPFAARVHACQAAVEDVYRETGRRALYAPHLSGTPQALYRQAELAQDAGVQLVMMAPMLVGLPAFHELIAERLRVPVLAHPALSGTPKIAPELLMGKLYRLLGADAVIFLTYGGRFSYSQATCRTLAANLRQPWSDLPPTLPVPAGGMTVARAAEMIDFYGRNVILLISGDLLAADNGDVATRSREFVKIVQESG